MSVSSPSRQVRRFRRDDRDQLTALVNAHARAVVPGTVVSVNRVLTQLEREPDEVIVDPWVRDRITLVAEQRGSIRAAAHLQLFADSADVGESYRGAGVLRWLLQWPPTPAWPDADDAGRAVLSGALEVLRAHGVRSVLEDFSLPAPGVYGVPEQWPHVERLLEDAGFARGDRSEIVLLADVAAIPVPAPIPGVEIRRTLGAGGVRLAAVRDERLLGYVEIDELGADAGTLGLGPRIADIANLWVGPGEPGGLLPWLLGAAARWLSSGRVDRLLAYVDETDAGPAGIGAAEHAALRDAGFAALTRTTRGWRLPAPATVDAATGQE